MTTVWRVTVQLANGHLRYPLVVAPSAMAAAERARHLIDWSVRRVLGVDAWRKP